MKIIGLTGGIGTGKSTVSRFLIEMGAVVINTDEVAHEALQSDIELQQEIAADFGDQILTAEGRIDRKRLGEIVFTNPYALARLNRIMHPRLYETIQAQLENYRQQQAEVIILEVPLLIEAGWTSLVDEVWITVAPEATVLKRLQRQVGLSAKQALVRIRSQMPTQERIKHADVVIDTDCRLDELKARAAQLWSEKAGI
jgi:dephospho-CoA kinase